MNVRNIFNDHDARPWWFLLIALLAALVLVQQAGAAMYWNFDNLAAGDQVVSGLQQQGDGEVTVANDPFYNELGCAVRTGVGAYPFTGSLKTTTSFPTDYWSFVHVKGVVQLSNIWFVLWDSEGGYIDSFQVSTAGPMSKMEIKKEGNDYYSRVNGGSWTNEDTIATTPYYYSIEGANSQQQLVDDIIIGTTGTNNIIVTIPDSWFVAKDIFNPSYTGIYDVVDHIAYEHDLHVKYVSDEVDRTIKIECIESGAIVNTTTTTTMCGYITYNVTTMLFNTDAPYGFYKIYFSDDPTIYDTFNYRAISTSGTSVQWDNSIYTDGDEATITFSTSEGNWDTDDYSYCVEVWDESLNEVESWAVPTRPINATKTIDVTTTNFGESGTFYCVLTATDLSSSEEMLLCYDDAIVTLPGSGEVIVEGETYNAITNLTLTSCTVTATQLGSTQSTTSDGTTGAYQISPLVTDWSIGMNASKTGYLGYLMAFIPYEGGTYGVDIPLVPSGGPAPGGSSNATTGYYNSTTDGTAIGGLCWEGPYWTASEGCTVTISNATWNTSCGTGAGGWYQCNNIGAGGSYTLTCNKTGYADYTKDCTLVEGCFNREDCTLDASNTLTVNLKDTDSLALLVGTEVTVSLDTGESTTTDTGTCTFSDLAYGSYVVTGSALGYYPGSTGVVMDAAKEVDVFLTNSEGRGEGAGAAYAPKSVKFSVQTLWGRAITECNVTCCGFETTAGSWSWLYDIFGLDYNETPIATSTMTGFTDDRGSINFLMLEPVQYECTFVKAGEINKTLDLYPKDDYYLVIATDFGNSSWLEGGVDINAAINCTVTTAKVNATAAYINFTYLDTTNQTTGGTVFLNQTNSTPGGAPILISSSALPAGCSSGCNVSFLVTGGYAGESYLVNCCPTHNYWDFVRSFSVTFPPEQVNPLGLTDTELMMIAAFFVIFTGCLFGAISAPHAPLAMSFMGWLMFALGWMDAMGATAIAALVLASVLSVLVLVMVRSKKERWV